MTTVIEKACDPSAAEKLPNEDLVYLEKYIEEFSASYVYTHRASSKDPWTEKLRESMTRNVKSSAYESLLNPENKYTSEDNDGKFVGENEEENERLFNDVQIHNFAREDVFKNASTKIPARLLQPLASYAKSIGQISCGRSRGTCWLVADSVVMTNHHVYMAMNTERMERQDPDLPIIVTFDYLSREKMEHVVTVKVDEEHDPQVESAQLDYKFLRLEEDEGLGNRDRLGPIVRNRSSQGLVVIVGHPAGEEMHHETCVVVRSHSWRDKLQQRREKSHGIHMTNEHLLLADKYQQQGCLAYDTTLFSGTSGSPVFDLNGNIVAMHTQGYPLIVEENKCSLMEFGIQFSAICEDLGRRNLLENYFPNYNLGPDEERMDEDNNEEAME